MTPSSFAVLGATGKTGRRVSHLLAALGHDVRPLSRTTSPPFDWHDATTYLHALRDADAAFVTYQPDISFPAAAGHLTHLTEAAREAGLRRLVLLSGRGEPDAEPAEDAVRRSGLGWTVLRCAWFMQNFSEHFLLPPVLDGVIALPAGATTEPFVDLDDVAEVAVAALLDPAHDGRTYDLTGPQLLSFADVAAELSRATGRRVDYVPVSPGEYAAAAASAGVPQEEITPLTDLFTRVLDGHNSSLSPDLAELLGRPPGTFADYARRAAASGAWDVSSPQPVR